jgi:DNA polymerase-1
MLKDEYASERQKAKMLNFSIAYGCGETAHGLSQDWGVTLAEADDMLCKWYDSRKLKSTESRELSWEDINIYRMHNSAIDKCYLGHDERAILNTPIQGSAVEWHDGNDKNQQQ